MHKNEKTANELYLDFVNRLSIAVKDEVHKNVFIWGNLILSLPFHVVTDSGINKNVHLMLESYKAKNLEFDDDSLHDLGKLFPSVSNKFDFIISKVGLCRDIPSHEKNPEKISNAVDFAKIPELRKNPNTRDKKIPRLEKIPNPGNFPIIPGIFEKSPRYPEK